MEIAFYWQNFLMRFCYILDDKVVIHTLLKMIIQNRPLLFHPKALFCALLDSSESPRREKSSLITEEQDQQVN